MHDGHAEIDHRLRSLLAERLRLDGPLEASASLRDLGLDSTALLSLVGRIEEEFDIEIDDRHITTANFGTLEGITRYVGARCAP